MKYEFELLVLGDADAIFICHYDENDAKHIILIDAGNVGDGETIKKHLHKYYGTYKIDLAICTHPDKDHKGGFFYLLNDDVVQIKDFWLTDPAQYIKDEDVKNVSGKKTVRKVRDIWENPTDSSENLIDLALDNCESVYTVLAGFNHDTLPISIVAPTVDYYTEIAKQMVADYGVKTYDDSDTEKYDEAAKVSDEDAKSVIDKENDDPSPYNASSLVLLYQPDEKIRVLVAGDANRASLTQMLKDYPELKKGVTKFKVPHHGSKHNLTTSIIDELKPGRSYISASGNKKHPNSSIVYWLSKYSDVYSTHKCSGYIHSHIGMDGREGDKSATPLKKKQ